MRRLWSNGDTVVVAPLSSHAHGLATAPAPSTMTWSRTSWCLAIKVRATDPPSESPTTWARPPARLRRRAAIRSAVASSDCQPTARLHR